VLQGCPGGLVALACMRRKRPTLFKGRHFEAEIIVLCIGWYLRFSLSFRNLEEIMAERNLSVDHVTIWRWVQRYAPELNRGCRPELRNTNRSWRVDETYCRVAGKWSYLYRAWIPAVLPSTFSSPTHVTRLPPNAFLKKRYVHRTASGRESSTWTGTRHIQGSLRS
jgi:hypothetical protein